MQERIRSGRIVVHSSADRTSSDPIAPPNRFQEDYRRRYRSRSVDVARQRLPLLRFKAGDRRGGRGGFVRTRLRGRNACGSLERLGSGASNGCFERNLAAARTSAGERQQTTRIGRCGSTRELGSRPVLRRPDPGACARDHCWRTGERRTATGKSDGDDLLPA